MAIVFREAFLKELAPAVENSATPTVKSQLHEAMLCLVSFLRLLSEAVSLWAADGIGPKTLPGTPIIRSAREQQVTSHAYMRL